MNKTRLYPFFLFLLVLATTGCVQQLKVNEVFPFEVTHMPYFTEIGPEGVGEVRCELRETQHFEGRRYFIRYFPTQGRGVLRVGKEGQPMTPNDHYPLPVGLFRLYYTPTTGSNSVDVTIEDDTGKSQTLNFTFQTTKQN